MLQRKTLAILVLIFLLGITLRFYYIYPDHLIFGYDQVADAISARKIVDYHDLIIRGLYSSTGGLNHGVLFSYFTAIPYFLGGGSPVVMAYWYAFFNALAIITIFIFVYFLFSNHPLALMSAFIMAISYNLVLMGGWISNTTTALHLIPFFFLGLWFYIEKRNWGLVMSSFFLGLLIQSQLLMVYNLAIFLIIWLIFKLRWPRLKNLLFSFFSFSVAILTIIIVEIETGFSGIKVFLNKSEYLEESKVSFTERFFLFAKQFLANFSLNLSPQYPKLGMVAGLVILLVIILRIVLKKETKESRKRIIFLLIVFISPIAMLLVGYHDKPWSLMGMTPAISVVIALAISKIGSRPIKLLLFCLITYLNISMIVDSRKKELLFISQEPSSILKGQLAVVDYTYQEAEGENFAINAVTYPLYYNTYWSYHYPWYGKKIYGYLPGWMGGDQLYPYQTLPKSTEDEFFFFMIVDETKAIPEVHKIVGKKWGLSRGKLLKEETIGGFTVQKFQRFN